MPNTPSPDEGILIAVLDRFENQHLPRVLQIKTRVDRGELLDEQEIQFLDRTLEDVRLIEPLVTRHPDAQELFSKAVDLYNGITSKALENEKSH